MHISIFMSLYWFCVFVCVCVRERDICTLMFCTLWRCWLKFKAVIRTLPFSMNQSGHTSSLVAFSPSLFLCISRQTLKESNEMTDRKGDRKWKLKYQKYEWNTLPNSQALAYPDLFIISKGIMTLTGKDGWLLFS